MLFTFSEEATYGLDSTSQEYTADLVSEEVITNIQYQKINQFNSPTSESRLPGIKTADGRIVLDLTYGNDAWNLLFKTLVGQTNILQNLAFSKSSEQWRILTGQLSADINDSVTSFTITEYKAGEFDNVDGIILGSEYIAISAISNGVVTGCTRASEGTTAASHPQYTLAYGVVSEAGKFLEIISRYRDGFCYSLPTSLTSLIYRDGNYFEFNGVRFADFIFNAQPTSFKTSLRMLSQNSKVIELASPSTTVDNREIVSPLDINCYSMNQSFFLRKLYFQISNTLNPSSAKFLDSTPSDILLSSHSVYGQFTLEDESLDAYNSYIGDDLKNLSITVCESRQFDNAYVFAFNNIRYGTLLRILYSNIDLKGDSVPFYTYDPDGFTIIIQTDSFPGSSSSCSSSSSMSSISSSSSSSLSSSSSSSSSSLSSSSSSSSSRSLSSSSSSSLSSSSSSSSSSRSSSSSSSSSSRSSSSSSSSSSRSSSSSSSSSSRSSSSSSSSSSLSSSSSSSSSSRSSSSSSSSSSLSSSSSSSSLSSSSSSSSRSSSSSSSSSSRSSSSSSSSSSLSSSSSSSSSSRSSSSSSSQALDQFGDGDDFGDGDRFGPVE